jgi:hypothetical protein
MPPRLFSFGMPPANKPPKPGTAAALIPALLDPPEALEERARPPLEELTDVFFPA